MWPFCPQLSFGLSTELTHICPTSYKVLWIAITNFLSFDCPYRTDTLHNCHREICQQNVLFGLGKSFDDDSQAISPSSVKYSVSSDMLCQIIIKPSFVQKRHFAKGKSYIPWIIGDLCRCGSGHHLLLLLLLLLVIHFHLVM